MIAGDEVAGTYNILHRYLFDRREDLRLPTAFLLSAQGEIVKVYREPIAAARIVEDIRENRRLRGRAPGAGRALPGDVPFAARANATTSSTAWSCRSRASTRRR